MKAEHITRRQSLWGPAAAVSAATLIPTEGVGATQLSATEERNLELALEFIALWGEPTTSAGDLAAFLTEDCVIVTSESRPAAVGRAAAEASFADYLARGRIKMDVLGSYAFGPAVLIGKIDTFVRPGAPGTGSPFAGLFVFRDGKIRHWTEYAGPKTA